MGNKLVYQCGRNAQIAVRGSVSGKTYQFTKCQPGLHETNCPVVEVDDADAPSLVTHVVAECRSKPFMYSIRPKEDHDLVFMRAWAEYQQGSKLQGQAALAKWDSMLQEERAKKSK